MRILLFLIVAAGCGWLRGESPARLLVQGDALDAKNQNAEALSLYLKANNLSPSDAEILRRIAKQYIEQMATAATKEKKSLGAQALAYAQQAVQAGPENAQTHLCLAIVYGKIAFSRSPRDRMEYSRLIKQEAEKAAALDPKNDLAWHVLGRWHYEVANLSGPVKFFAETLYGPMPEASNEKAIDCLRRAEALNPGRLSNLAELGRALAAQGRKDEARASLEKALKMPSREKDDDETKARAERALAALD